AAVADRTAQSAIAHISRTDAAIFPISVPLSSASAVEIVSLYFGRAVSRCSLDPAATAHWRACWRSEPGTVAVCCWTDIRRARDVDQRSFFEFPSDDAARC